MTSPDLPQPPERLALRVRGRVQGVGFRPAVYRIARKLGLGGHVGNDEQGVFIEIEGPAPQVATFQRRLRDAPPPLARIDAIETHAIPPRGDTAFRIAPSASAPAPTTQVAPDAATCADCLAEMRAPYDRRYRYPFINCTHCGPRYSIVAAIPYDRPNTTMRGFPMCPDCRREYEDPADRRFHAQPVACPVCGPRVWLADRSGNEQPGDAIAETARLLEDGRIVAVKGLGGFHLACRADRDEPVALLRERKGRDAKPFALMVGTVEVARNLCRLSPEAETLLLSPATPIVLAPRRADAPVSRLVAPGNAALGVMLAYTPLHHLLFDTGLPPLVMTSGNPSEEPLCHDNDEALKRLAHLADAFLLHDRPIQRPIDDSVLISLDTAPSIVPVRRARGYVPAPITLSPAAPRPILALGGELKSTLCFARGGEAILSEHLGELSNPAAWRGYLEAAERLASLLEIKPEIIACDMHPGYASTRHAHTLADHPVSVQHHHAHIASVMAEHGLDEPVVGIAADGTGYGTDGTIWGCEILVCTLADFTRAGHLAAYPLPGGDAAARDTWRPAASLLHAAFGAEWRERAQSLFERVDPASLDIVETQLANHASGARKFPAGLTTSSLGRLFDAVAFLLGLCDNNTFEARAAIALESAAIEGKTNEPLGFDIAAGSAEQALRLDPTSLIRQIAERRAAGAGVASLARGFHEAIARSLADGATHIAKTRGLKRVAMSGGCLANRLLATRLFQHLSDAGLEVFAHREAPTGDGGVALGQAAVAATRDRLRKDP